MVKNGVIAFLSLVAVFFIVYANIMANESQQQAAIAAEYKVLAEERRQELMQVEFGSNSPVFIESEEFAKLDLPFSEAVRYANLIFVSGQIGDELESGEIVEGGIQSETRQAMRNIKRILEANGSSMDQIIKCTCMLADISEWAQMSKVYMEFFPDHKPARSAFATTGLALNAKVEIECIAGSRLNN